jgi:hypothetical protein
LDSFLDIVARGVGRFLRALGIKPKVSYWTKYHELYLKGEFDLVNKKHFLEEYFVESVGYFPNIDNPTTFNEKIQWYKLYYNDLLIAKCIDKVTFKDYVTEVLGSEYVVPSLGVYANADEINFDELPNQFVIKANFGSSAKEIIIVNDKSKLDMAKTRKTISSWEKPWWRSAWGGYEFVQPRILIEEYIEQTKGQVYDYKFLCFNGDPKFVIAHIDRFTRRTVDIYDLDWKKMDITYNDPPNSKEEIEQPQNFSRMIEISKQISKRFPLVRVDFYEAGGRLYIGELTFYPDGGMSRYYPEEWDRKFGEMLVLPEKMP